MLSLRTLIIIMVFLVAALLVRNELRLTTIEQKLDSIIYSSEPIKYTTKDLDCLAKNVYHEARGEDEAGKYAVAHVTLNRLKTGYWGKSICKVVYAPKQFSWTIKRPTKPVESESWNDSLAIAKASLLGARVRDLDRSLFYHADYIKTPYWADLNSRVTQIGQHIFYNKAKNSWLEM